MELRAKYEANVSIEIPVGIHIESKADIGNAQGRPKMMHIWSTSTVSSEDAVAQISLMMRALEHALSAGGNDV